MAIAALVLSVLALITMWIPVIGIAAIPMSIVGLILGVVGKKQLSVAGKPGGVAVAGIVMSIIALAISTIFTLICGACAACACAPLPMF